MKQRKVFRKKWNREYIGLILKNKGLKIEKIDEEIKRPDGKTVKVDTRVTITMTVEEARRCGLIEE